MSENQLIVATVASHFGYGALFGAVYALLRQRWSIPSAILGPLFGLMVWVGSYLGWLPAVGILPPSQPASVAEKPGHDRGTLGLGGLTRGGTTKVEFKRLKNLS